MLKLHRIFFTEPQRALHKIFINSPIRQVRGGEEISTTLFLFLNKKTEAYHYGLPSTFDKLDRTEMKT